MPASRARQGYALPEGVLIWFDVHFEPSGPKGRFSLACRNASGSMRQICIGPLEKIRPACDRLLAPPRAWEYMEIPFSASPN